MANTLNTVLITTQITVGKDRIAIMQCEINVETGEKLTPTKPVWSGNGGRYLESPHLYHIDHSP